LGCGDGKTLSAMPAGWRIAAIDISPEALRLARKLKNNAGLILADGCQLPLRSESFDAVFVYHVAGHLFQSERRALAREVARVLRPGCRLFFRDFSEQDMRAGQGEEVETGTFRRKSGIITHYFGEGEVAGIFSGLKMDFIITHNWKMRIKGKELVRSEMEAIFLK
jgi:ubiquinone/menaquinone biosynthesis C-methylase UbiE